VGIPPFLVGFPLPLCRGLTGLGGLRRPERLWSGLGDLGLGLAEVDPAMGPAATPVAMGEVPLAGVVGLCLFHVEPGLGLVP